MIQGFTDSVPTNTARFPSNWYLSTDRANAVLQFLLTRGVNADSRVREGFSEPASDREQRDRGRTPR